jgi:hypothetical protein
MVDGLANGIGKIMHILKTFAELPPQSVDH